MNSDNQNPIIFKDDSEISICLDMSDDVLTVGDEMEKINELAYMNGYNWEAFFNYYLPRYAPELWDGIDLDGNSEAQTFVALYKLTPENEVKVEKFVKLIRELITNKEELCRIVRDEGDSIEWD